MASPSKYGFLPIPGTFRLKKKGGGVTHHQTGGRFPHGQVWLPGTLTPRETP